MLLTIALVADHMFGVQGFQHTELWPLDRQALELQRVDTPVLDCVCDGVSFL